MLAHKPIRLHPDKPNNYNPIYEDDYVELGIRAMEVAATPPVVVNWAGSETVSVEEYCTYMGDLVGVEPIFEYTADAHTPLWPDVTHMHEVLGAHESAVARRLSPDDRSASPRNQLTEHNSTTPEDEPMQLPGTPSDEVAGVLAAGRGDITTLFVSMATPPPRRDGRRLPAVAHPRPPARAAPAVGRARVAATGVDAGVPGRAGVRATTASTRSTT